MSEIKAASRALVEAQLRNDDRKLEEQNGRRQKLEATVAQQQKEIQVLTATLKAQAAQIQKVSDQLRTQAQAARVVAND